jgi:phage-related protein
MLSSPQVRIVFYQDPDGSCPVVDFLLRQPARVQQDAQARIQLLAERGHTLRRPHCDNLGAGLWELRWRLGRVQYRILYAFHGRGAAILLHALTKKTKLLDADLTRAQRRRQRFTQDPPAHTKVLT